MKSSIQRIQFYTRKAARHVMTARHRQKPRRHDRLVAYKTAMNKRLATEG